MLENTSQESPIEDRILTPSRRLFLKAALGIGALVLIDGWKSLEHLAPNVEGAPSEPVGTSNPLVRPIEEYDERLREVPSLSSTIEETLIATGAAIGYAVASNNRFTRLWSGNSINKEIMENYKNNRLKTAALTIVVAPVTEELIFRGIPAIAGNKGLMPVRGIISTYIFGKGHQLQVKKNPTETGIEESKPKLSLNKNMVPVQQYGMGAFLWMIARRRGLKHSIAAHATVNAIAIAGLEVSTHIGKKGPEEIIGNEV